MGGHTRAGTPSEGGEFLWSPRGVSREVGFYRGTGRGYPLVLLVGHSTLT